MKRHVLLIEDEPYILWLIRYLEKRGHTVEWAKSVSEARKAIQGAGQQGYNVVIVDVLMPAANDAEAQTIGIELARDIRRTAWGQNAKIVIYSVVKPEDFWRNAKSRELDVSDVKFVSKQSDESELKEYLEKEARI